MAALTITNLMTQLSSYGLNPNEWNLIPLTTGSVLLKKKDDQFFQFLGRFEFKKGKATWSQLQLHSI